VILEKEMGTLRNQLPVKCIQTGGSRSREGKNLSLLINQADWGVALERVTSRKPLRGRWAVTLALSYERAIRV